MDSIGDGIVKELSAPGNSFPQNPPKRKPTSYLESGFLLLGD
jgi:hypothetical protein